jgi:alanyl-tRNA synthetase
MCIKAETVQSYGQYILHFGEVAEGTVTVGDSVAASSVDCVSAALRLHRIIL